VASDRHRDDAATVPRPAGTESFEAVLDDGWSKRWREVRGREVGGVGGKTRELFFVALTTRWRQRGPGRQAAGSCV